MDMKRSDKWVLGLSLGAVAVLLLGALGYAAVENIRADNARIERDEWERMEAARKLAVEKHARQVAFWKTPEGKLERQRMEAHAKRVAEQNAVADREMEKLRWAPWQRVAKAFQEAGFDTLPSTEPQMIRAVVPFDSAVRLTNYEITELCTIAYKTLGDGSVVELKSPSGVLLGKADGWSVKAYK